MQTSSTGNKLHPVLWVAAVAVILLSAAGIGAIFGVIPGVGGTPKQAEPVATAAPEPAAQPAPEAKPAPAKAKSVQAPKPAAKPAPQPAPVLAQQSSAQPVAPPCPNCGVIESFREVQQKGEGTGLGAVGGAVLGGVLGHQIGKGGGKDLATVAGAVAGGVAGHQVEKNVRTNVKYQITVRLEDGSSRVLTQSAVPTWRAGDPVRIENGVITAR